MSFRSFTFGASLVTHLLVLGSLMPLVFKPLYLSFGAAASLVLLAIASISVLHGWRYGLGGLRSYTLGAAVAVAVVMLGAMVVAWIAGAPPNQPLSASGFIAYYTRGLPSSTEWGFIVVPPVAILGVVAIGHAIGLWLHSRTTVSGRDSE